MTEDKRIEFIESYIKIGNSDYKWNDNHGELIRCKDCAYYSASRNGVNGFCRKLAIPFDSYEWCSRAERKEE